MIWLAVNVPSPAIGEDVVAPGELFGDDSRELGVQCCDLAGDLL